MSQELYIVIYNCCCIIAEVKLKGQQSVLVVMIRTRMSNALPRINERHVYANPSEKSQQVEKILDGENVFEEI